MLPAMAWQPYWGCPGMTAQPNIYFPSATVNNSAAVGDFVSDWSPFVYGKVTYAMCIIGTSSGSEGDSYNLYYSAERPAGTEPASGPGVPATIPETIDGQTLSHTIWTTPTLKAQGLGFIFRWYTEAAFAPSVHSDWVTPPANWSGEWTQPANSGQPFYRAYIHRVRNDTPDCRSGTPPWGGTPPRYYQGTITSLSQWYAVVAQSAAHPVLSQRKFCSIHSLVASFRLVLIKPLSDLPAVDPYASSTITIPSHPLVIIKAAQATKTSFHGSISTTFNNAPITFTFPYTATCTTGDVVVPLGAVWVSALPNVGSTAPPRDFDITLTQCPKVNIGYSFVPPTGVGYNNSNAVLNLDSTATAQGVGIQLRHRNAPNYGNNLIQYNPTAPTTPTYTRTASQGVNNPTGGVDHTIPMRAAIYRTGTVQPGTVRASVIVHIVYP